MPSIAKLNIERHLAGVLKRKWLKKPAHTGVSFFILMLFVVLALSITLAGCGSAPKKTASPDTPTPTTSTPSSGTPKSGGYYQDDGPGPNPPSNLDTIPDAVPRDEPLHRGANKPYVVFGKTYVPNVAPDAFRQQGMASWYGKQFHGQKTSIGETYDMYAMTAAHPTLPIPSYVRVTNPANNKTVVVRVNDRGPFHAERVIDLSFAAATRLDIVRRGSAPVVVERVFQSASSHLANNENATARATSASTAQTTAQTIPPASPIAAESSALFLQLGAFGSIENADIFRARMERELTWNRDPIVVSQKDRLFRVRMGPYSTRAEAEAIQAKVKASHDFSPIISKP